MTDPHPVLPGLLALRACLPSLSDRNIVEMVALLQRRKRVVRLVLDCWEWLVLRETLPNLGLVGRNAHFQLQTRASTRLGDRFTVAAPWNDQQAQSLLIYLAQTMEDVEHALTLEKKPEDPALGAWLGYPSCCVRGYREIVAGRPWVDQLVDVPTTHGLSLYANKLGYLFRGSPSFLPDYYPCSLACSASAALGRENAAGLEAFGLAELARSMREKLLRPIVYLPGLLTQLAQARREGADLVFDPCRVEHYDFGFSEGRILFEKGRISLETNELDGLTCRVITFADDFNEERV